mmetsp:Transcript_34613/g.75568  ORF Transcript_34613/g.75568 Transcript_34613/m.75568 type:complete len:157 (-) Transcript_34613:7-477(-)
MCPGPSSGSPSPRCRLLLMAVAPAPTAPNRAAQAKPLDHVTANLSSLPCSGSHACSSNPPRTTSRASLHLGFATADPLCHGALPLESLEGDSGREERLAPQRYHGTTTAARAHARARADQARQRDAAVALRGARAGRAAAGRAMAGPRPPRHGPMA